MDGCSLFNGCFRSSPPTKAISIGRCARSKIIGLSFWDAMLWATARRAGCSVLLSEDFQDGRRLDGVLFVDPFAPENQRLVDLALPALPRT